jgi:hypothetical protein
MLHIVLDVLLLALVVLLAGGLIVWRRRPDPLPDAPEPVRRPVEVAAPIPVAPVTPPPPTRQDPTVLIRYVSKQGRVLGEQRIPRTSRRVSRTFQYRGKTGTFVASAQTGDGAWVYRHCGDERE